MTVLALGALATPVPPASAQAPAPSVAQVSPPAEASFGGIEVTLTGSDCAGAVRFGLVAADGFSDTRMTATSPPQPAGTVVHVQVTTGGGTSPVADGDTFTCAEGNWVPAGTVPQSSRGPATLLPSARSWWPGAASKATGERRTAPLQKTGSTAPPSTSRCGARRAGHSPTTCPVPSLAAPPSRRWRPPPPMPQGAALLVAFPSALLYDPVATEWSDVTGAMATDRRMQFSTVLAGGGVLVAGGTSTRGPRRRSHHEGQRRLHLGRGPFTAAHEGPGITGPLLADGTTVVGQQPLHAVRSAPADATATGLEFTPSPLTSELYDPTDRTWSRAGFMTTPHRGHTATLLKTDDVLLVGGHRDEDYEEPLASAEIYDPRDRSWRRTTPIARTRTGHTATLLGNGDVLVVGAGGDASPEVYHPGNGTADSTWRATGARAPSEAGTPPPPCGTAP